MIKYSGTLQPLLRGTIPSGLGLPQSLPDLCVNICQSIQSRNSRSFLCLNRFTTSSESRVRNNSKDEGKTPKKKRLDSKEMLDNAATFENIDTIGDDQNWTTSPYPKGSERIKRRSQASYSLRPNMDPRQTSILLFPGQGTQFVGMGKKLMNFPVARDLFDYANEILQYDLKKLCLEGPIEELSKTVHSQPAIFVCSLAAVERLKEEQPTAIENCMAAAGYSLGEISALTFAGALTFERALMLVKVRAEAMQLASEMAPGGMATIFYGPDHKLGLALSKARDWCAERGIEGPVCSVASYLYPDCKVIAGHEEALRYIEENKALYRIKRVQRLRVSGAFHTDLMKPAIGPFVEALRSAGTSDPFVSVHSNLDGKRYNDAKQVYMQLPKLLYKPIKWEQTLHVLYERPQGSYFPRTFECGPGETLKSILQKVNLLACRNFENIGV
nr:PREDICTED: probable malonyl-CoA-acyl carrier protein transacylase, mitochondrial [Bemisia tabaci]